MEQNSIDLLKSLNDKFNINFSDCVKTEIEGVSELFLKARAISEIGQILIKNTHHKHQEKCCSIFDEVFSDVVVACYLASCAIDKPARIVLRRALELGVAVIYLWDLPHIVYSWELCKQDLNFGEMISHINDEGFKKLVEAENDVTIGKGVMDTKLANKLYSDLSDFVHGHIKTFESNLSERYSFIESDFNEFETIASNIIDLLLNSYLVRFPVSEELFKIIPALKKQKENL